MTNKDRSEVLSHNLKEKAVIGLEMDSHSAGPSHSRLSIRKGLQFTASSLMHRGVSCVEWYFISWAYCAAL